MMGSSSPGEPTTSPEESQDNRVLANQDGKSEKGRQMQLLERPTRPLSAYNLFFRDEREKLIKTLPPQKEPGKYAKKRKSHYKISFGDLAKTIATRWKNIDQQLKKKYEAIAVVEKKNYKLRVQAWVAQRKALGLPIKMDPKRKGAKTNETDAQQSVAHFPRSAAPCKLASPRRSLREAADEFEPLHIDEAWLGPDGQIESSAGTPFHGYEGNIMRNPKDMSRMYAQNRCSNQDIYHPTSVAGTTNGRRSSTGGISMLPSRPFLPEMERSLSPIHSVSNGFASTPFRQRMSDQTNDGFPQFDDFDPTPIGTNAYHHDSSRLQLLQPNFLDPGNYQDSANPSTLREFPESMSFNASAGNVSNSQSHTMLWLPTYNPQTSQMWTSREGATGQLPEFSSPSDSTSAHHNGSVYHH